MDSKKVLGQKRKADPEPTVSSGWGGGREVAHHCRGELGIGCQPPKHQLHSVHSVLHILSAVLLLGTLLTSGKIVPKT